MIAAFIRSEGCPANGASTPPKLQLTETRTGSASRTRGAWRIAMDAETLFKSICERIPDAMKRHRVPGLAFGIVANGREFSAGFGVTNVRHPLPVDDHTLFQIGSITKTYTATAIARLAEMGRLGLDEPVRRYLPGFRMRDTEVTERATVRHLLVHTGGWQGDFFEDTGAGDDALKKYVALMADLPQLTPLGKVWSYNNAAFSLAGRVIEAVTGKTYDAALHELVLAPLGLRHTYIFPGDVMTHGFAVGHASVQEQDIVLRPWGLARSAWPAGGLTSSVKDQLRYARFHLGDGTAEDGTRVLSRESMDAMQTPSVPALLDQKIGLAWHIREQDGVRIFFHGGGTLGQTSILTLFPQRKLAISWLTNSVAGGLVMLRGDDLLREYLGIKKAEPAHIAMTAEQLQQYVGRYTSVLDEIELKPGSDGALVAQVTPKGGFPTRESPAPPAPPPTRVAFVGTDHAITLDPPLKDQHAEFLRDDSGAIEWARVGGRIHRRL
jgi:CubicO group peptidase (beta-lactamase class C family)